MKKKAAVRKSETAVRSKARSERTPEEVKRDNEQDRLRNQAARIRVRERLRNQESKINKMVVTKLKNIGKECIGDRCRVVKYINIELVNIITDYTVFYIPKHCFALC